MIARPELESYARSLGFNIYQAEKDYLQHAFLAALYSVSAAEFVFKGGTALQKAYGMDRFSEDLDFTFVGVGPTTTVASAVARLAAFADTILVRTEEKKRSLSMKLKIKGPLYRGVEKTVQTLVLEVSLREAVQQKPAAVRIVPVYADLAPYVAAVMTLDEMLAEKIRAIMTRDRPRDLYDAWFLLKKGASFDRPLVGTKLAFYAKTFSREELERAVEKKKAAWERELRPLMRAPPAFEEIAEHVLTAVK